MKKSEELIADVVITLIRFIVGVVLGMLIWWGVGRHGQGEYFLRWIYGDFRLDDWFVILSILILGICSALWGDKVLRRFWAFIED